MYEPTGAGVPASKPGFVIIHGGGFVGGDKAQGNFVAFANEYASRGYVCISINYRLMGDDPPTPGSTAIERAINAAIEDAAKAIAWMKTNAGTYGIDSSRIAMGGNSAGAITSLFTGYQELGPTAEVQAIVSFAGGMYGFESEINTGDPPVLLVHSDDDGTVAHSLSVDVHHAANLAGVLNEFYSLTGVGHGAFGARNSYDVGDGETPNEKIQAFLFAHLKLWSIAAGPIGSTIMPGAEPIALFVLILGMMGVALRALRKNEN